MCGVFFLCFFFSSRRRHTRLTCDWSSDVCSSDLEGKPGDYQLAYIEALKRELADATNEFAGLVDKDLPALNDALKAKNQPTISPPPQKVAVDEGAEHFAGGGGNRPGDADAIATKIGLPADFRVLH